MQLRCIFFVVSLLNMVYVQGMEFPYYVGRFKITWEDHELWQKRIQELAQEKAHEAEKYNKRNKLFNLPDNRLQDILFYSHTDNNENDAVQSLTSSMRHYGQLKAMCKHLNNTLTYETIGNFCKNYDLATRNTVFLNILKRSCDKNIRLPILSLDHAGADCFLMYDKNYSTALVRKILVENDIQMFKLLFKHQMYPEFKWFSPQAVSLIQTIEMAKIFEESTGLCSRWGFSDELLWAIVKNGNSYEHEYAAELIPFYIKHDVNARSLDGQDWSCLLHGLAENAYTRNSENFLKKAQFILDVIPDMINRLNKSKRTPLDIAYEKLELFKKNDFSKFRIQAVEQLIALFKKYGAVTAEEIQLKQLRFDCESPESIYRFVQIALKYPALMSEDELIKLLRMLIASKSITEDTLGKTVHCAACSDDQRALDILLNVLGNQAGKIICSSYPSALHVLCKKGDLNKIKIFIHTVGESAAEYVCKKNEEKETSLLISVSKKFTDISRLLMQMADKQIWRLLSAQNLNGNTALMIAACNNDVEMLKELIIAADDHVLEYLNMRNKGGFTAIHMADPQCGKREAYNFLIKTSKNFTKKECSLCLEEKMLGEQYIMRNCKKRSGCNMNFCTECLLAHITTHLDEGSTLNLNCPNQQCGQKMKEKDIRKITKHHKDIYGRYLEIAFKEHMLNDPNIKHCQTPNCTFSFVLENDIEREKIKCACQRTYCSHCLFNHSFKITCDKAREDRILVQDFERDDATQKWITENTKPCPQCKTSIQKNGGCFWMKCKKCKHQFCWQCLQPHDHTINHPCGLWEDDVQMNQANQQLAQQLEQEDREEPGEQNEEQFAVVEAQEQPQEEPVIEHPINNAADINVRDEQRRAHRAIERRLHRLRLNQVHEFDMDYVYFK